MTKQTKVIAALAALTMLGAAGYGAARAAQALHHPGPAMMAKFVSWKVGDTLDSIKATDAQRAVVGAAKDRLLAEAQKQADAHVAVHEAMLAQWNADTVDRAKLHALVDARIDDFRASAHLAIDSLSDVHDVLTPAQRAQVADEFQKLHEGPHHP